MAREPEDNFRNLQALALQVNVAYNAQYESSRLQERKRAMCLGAAGAAGAFACSWFAKGRAFRGPAGVVGFVAGAALANRVFFRNSDDAHKLAGDDGCGFYRVEFEELLREYYANPAADLGTKLDAARCSYLGLVKKWPSPSGLAWKIAKYKCAVDSSKRDRPEECKVWGGMRWRYLPFGGALVKIFPTWLAILPCHYSEVLRDEAMRSFNGPFRGSYCEARERMDKSTCA